ncbi:putative nuclease HARBI1 isoform X1 [Musca vetustissima]|uniref:putative nuclease HARBI1 isoform X1 n=1 Tax=Musca vetustissima TaxID=27455 RepID=UPI002AB61DF1|nr:putative nuclease HARBI1 isoform X1 [Musca vetustissima]
MDTCFFVLSSSEDEDGNNIKIIRRQIRERSDPLSLSENAFRQRFRLTKEAFRYVLSRLDFSGHMSSSIPAVLQLASTLSLLASGSFQHTVGNDFLIGMSQSATCRVVQRVAKEMELKLCPEHINFSPDQSALCMEHFCTKFRIPGVIGCVDGTHFGLQKPTENEHMFFNRKGYHSLNSMIICDHQHIITAILSKYGGAAHDSFVWKHSDERRLLEQMYTNNSFKNGWLLADSGYPLEPWCITPYRNPADGSPESKFNEVHSSARCIVERTIGILKARWKIVCHDRRSRYSPVKMALFGNVCAALHNICIKFKVPMYTEKDFNIESVTMEVETSNHTQPNKIGEKIRNQIKTSLYQSM